MFIQEFNYHFFEPITFDQFYGSFDSLYQTQSVENARQIFNDWIIFFSHRSFLFYRAQYEYHQGIIEKEFSIENGIPEGHSFSEYGLDEKWEYFAEDRGLTDHYNECENWCSRAENRARQARFENNIPDSHSSKETVQYLIKTINELSQKQRPPIRFINELWFNNTITNSSEVISMLRNTPYPEYLKTKHWQRVRAAMLFIHKAICQAEGHHEQSESWYFGWESEIDVHHLHYRNKGNERYTDLALLCKDHHKLWHYNQDNKKPQIKILDSEWF